MIEITLRDRGRLGKEVVDGQHAEEETRAHGLSVVVPRVRGPVWVEDMCFARG